MNQFTRIVSAAAFILSASNALAAIPNSQSKLGSENSIRSILDLPLNQRLDRLEEKGAAGYRSLVSLMFNEKETMDTRWKAVTAAARVGGKDAKPELERALKHSTWYMRNAGLVAMQGLDRQAALKWAERLLNDKALLVRVAAVDVISEIGSQNNASTLWEKLYSQQNYKGGQSLFIRNRIVSALSRIEGPGKEAAFIKLLSDSDESIHPAAMQALERTTRKSFGPVDTDLTSRRAQWLNWWKTRKG